VNRSSLYNILDLLVCPETLLSILVAFHENMKVAASSTPPGLQLSNLQRGQTALYLGLQAQVAEPGGRMGLGPPTFKFLILPK